MAIRDKAQLGKLYKLGVHCQKAHADKQATQVYKEQNKVVVRLGAKVGIKCLLIGYLSEVP